MFAQVIKSGNPTLVPNLVHVSPWRGLLGKRVRYNLFFKFMAFLGMGTHTRLISGFSCFMAQTPNTYVMLGNITFYDFADFICRSC